MLAHTLGNPFNLDKVTEICKKNNLWLVEDNCDALGSKYNGKFAAKYFIIPKDTTFTVMNQIWPM